MAFEFAKRIYDRLPVSAQNLILSGYSYKLGASRYGAEYRDWVERLKQSEGFDSQRLRSLQNEALREIVQHAARTVPYYRRKYAEHGVTIGQVQDVDDLRRLLIP